MAPEEDQELLQKAEPLISATVASSLERSSDPISPHCHPDANGVDATTPLPSPIQGKSDWRNYSSVRLPNGVVVCAASDPQSKTTAASATVRAGAAHDPREMPGLAHFLEHMCFLGSAKYPGENDYKKFLSQHGGQSNASTSLFVTNYKFEVLADFADTALDMFSQFFVDPLLTESGTKREVNAVDSENSKNLTADARRRLQILKDVCDREHYFTKFTTGNLSTLLTSRRRLLRDQQQNAPAGDDAPERNEEEEEEDVKVLRQALLCFHATHYRPDRLTVTVVGPQSTDQLLGMVVPRFAPMRPRAIDATAETIDRVIRQWIDDAAQDPPPFGYAPWQSPPAAAVPFRSPLFASALGSLLVTKPVTSQRRLVLLFPLPRYCQPPDGVDSDRSPIHLISHLLGHEGPGSSFALLQNKEWITSLSAGSRMTAPDFTLFQIDLQLTPCGESEWKQVVAVVLQHARLIENEARRLQQQSETNKGEEDSRLHNAWDECSVLSRMFFQHASPGSAYDFAPHLCGRIVEEGTERCLSAGCLLEESMRTLPFHDLADAASRLRIENCLLERCSQTAWQEAEDELAVLSDSSKTEVTTTFQGYDIRRKTEPWYGVDYFSCGLSSDDVQGWTVPDCGKFLDAADLLTLPRPNRYVPRTLDLCAELPDEAKTGPRIEKAIDPPQLLVSNALGRLWHRMDDRYALPKSIVTVLIRNAAVQSAREGLDATTGAVRWRHDDRAAVLSSLLAGIFNQAQAQETYDADLAGLHWSLSLTSSGILISCSGFSDRLSDLALKILADFFSGDFLQEAYFQSSRDRVVRGLRTFLESRRADSDAMYYRDLLLSSGGLGVRASLAAAEASTLKAVKDHHLALLENEESIVECLYTGNVSRDQALSFFDSASAILSSSGASSRKASGAWVPGESERRLAPGQDVELHFSSLNPQEENGAVLVTYQSSIPGYCGDELSSRESLESTAAIRLICHMLREPLFDELRTKQTLGYVVSSYYDVSVSSRSRDDASLGPLRVPVDFLVINVLSRKLPPPEISQRIDAFLDQFRESLVQMPESQIQYHATALKTKLLKPIQKLGIEAQTHFAKISRYAPEVLDGREHDASMLPWTSVESLASSISRMRREDLLRAWDRLVLPQNRARVVSCVYGSTFPLRTSSLAKVPTPWRCKLRIVNDADQIVLSRGLFPFIVDKSPSPRPSRTALVFSRLMSRAPSVAALQTSNVKTAAAAMVFGAGIAAAGWSLFHTWRKSQK